MKEKRYSQEEMGTWCTCNLSKCKGFISILYLENNQYEIISQKISPQSLEKKIKKDKNFVPDLIAVKSSHKRKGRGIRSEIMYRPLEYISYYEKEVEIGDKML